MAALERGDRLLDELATELHPDAALPAFRVALDQTVAAVTPTKEDAA